MWSGRRKPTWCWPTKPLVHCRVKSLILTLKISKSSQGACLYQEVPQGLNLHLKMKTITIWLCLCVHLAFNLKQWKKRKTVLHGMEKNIQGIASDQCWNTKWNNKISKPRWGKGIFRESLAISLKHTWKRKLNTNAATVVLCFHRVPLVWLARR